MAAKLTLYPARGASRHYILHDGETRQAGRDPASNDFVFDDPRVSGSHARLEWTGRGWTLRDLGSKNGTFITGSPAAGTPLTDEDWVSFGSASRPWHASRSPRKGGGSGSSTSTDAGATKARPPVRSRTSTSRSSKRSPPMSRSCSRRSASIGRSGKSWEDRRTRRKSGNS